MKYINQVNLNRIPFSYDITGDFEKARQYHLKHGIEWEDIFKNININGYQSTHDPMLNRYLIRETEKLVTLNPLSTTDTFVFDMAEWSTPLGSQYPLKPETPNGCCYIVGNKPYMTIGTYPTEHASGETWIQIAHEKMHALVRIANLKGYPVADVMDSYKENNTPDSPTGNFAQQWVLLKPFLDSQNGVVLTRKMDDGIQTLGELNCFGKLVCKTLERPWKNNQPSISCIPKGIYSVKWTYSFKFLKFTYEIQNVLKRSGIRIHSANYFFDLEGCIALGTGYEDINHDREVDIINSRITIKSFEDLMGRKDFTLIII